MPRHLMFRFVPPIQLIAFPIFRLLHCFFIVDSILCNVTYCGLIFSFASTIKVITFPIFLPAEFFSSQAFSAARLTVVKHSLHSLTLLSYIRKLQLHAKGCYIKSSFLGLKANTEVDESTSIRRMFFLTTVYRSSESMPREFMEPETLICLKAKSFYVQSSELRI